MSNAAGLMRPRLLYACLFVSRIIIICRCLLLLLFVEIIRLCDCIILLSQNCYIHSSTNLRCFIVTTICIITFEESEGGEPLGIHQLGVQSEGGAADWGSII